MGDRPFRAGIYSEECKELTSAFPLSPCIPMGKKGEWVLAGQVPADVDSIAGASVYADRQ